MLDLPVAGGHGRGPPAGLKTSATMMFGHLETRAERVEHLVRIRELQDETGGFTAFIPWTYQPGGTDLTGAARARWST